MLRVVVDDVPAREDLATGLDEIVREGARRMLAAALEAEVAAYLAAFADQVDERGRRLVVRNGHARPRPVTTAAGAVGVAAPRVNDKRVDAATGERARFRSVILPPWCRKSPKVAEVLPLLYLHGLSSGDFVPALEEFFGSAAGLSASVITRLTTDWQDQQRAFAGRDLSGVDYVYIWVDGVHFTVRLDEARLCTLVIVGVRADGSKELVAVADGHRESTESWADLLRDCKRRGMRAPVLAVGDGALGFWAALREVFPATREQRCWVHRAANVLNCLPTSAQPAARAGAGGDPRCGGPRPRRGRHRPVPRAVRCEVPEGGCEDRRRPAGAAGVLRLPRRALDPPQDHQPDRVHVLDGAAAHPGDEGAGQPCRRPGDGLQAAAGGAGPVAGGERAAPGRARPGRCDVPRGTARRASRRHRQEDPQEGTEAGTDHGSGEGCRVIM
jgi:putative transposase